MTVRAAIGIDIGGTKTLCLLVNEDLKIISSVKFKTASRKSKRGFTDRLTRVLKELKNSAKHQELTLVAVGAGCAGSVDTFEGKIKAAPNLLFLEDYPIAKTVKAATG